MSLFSSVSSSPVVVSSPSSPLVGGGGLPAVSWSYADPCTALDGSNSNSSPLFPPCTMGLLRNSTTTPEPSLSDDGEEEDGVTPTPRGKDFNTSSASATSSDLLGIDSCLPLGFDLEDLDAGSNTPLFKTPAEASAYLKAPRSDMDMEVQRCLRTYEKSESLSSAVSKWQKEGRMGEAERAVSLKILVHEAANRSLKALEKRKYHTPRPSTPPPCAVGCDCPRCEEDDEEIVMLRPSARRHEGDESHSETSAKGETLLDARISTFCSWKTIEENVVSDACMYGYQTPQRHLSCMCIFNPELTDVSSTSSARSSTPLPCRYGESDDDRAMRSTRRAQMVRTLQLQQAVQQRRLLAKGIAEKPFLFLLGNKNGGVACRAGCNDSSEVAMLDQEKGKEAIFQIGPLSRRVAAMKQLPSWQSRTVDL